MDQACQSRVLAFQQRMADQGLDLALLADADSIVYFSGYANYLAMDFGRPTLLGLLRDGAPVLITPAMEAEMAKAMTGLAAVEAWSDGENGEWRSPLARLVEASKARRIGIETGKTHPLIAAEIAATAARQNSSLEDVTPLVGALRMIKSPEELAVMAQAGQVAVAMGAAGRAAIGEGVPEYEVALAVIAGGTRKAAELLDGAAGADPADIFCSPTIHNLQVLQSGAHTCMVHRRSSVRRIERGDPVYLCFCGIANFRHFKLGFDREFWVGSVSDEQARAYETVVEAQQAALAEIRPGALAKDVHAAAEEVYRSSGYGPAYRTGRGIGYSFLETPELKRGDETRLQAGMTFAVDGGLGVPGRFGARIGDSIAVTADGFAYLTDFPRALAVL